MSDSAKRLLAAFAEYRAREYRVLEIQAKLNLVMIGATGVAVLAFMIFYATTQHP